VNGWVNRGLQLKDTFLSGLSSLLGVIEKMTSGDNVIIPIFGEFYHFLANKCAVIIFIFNVRIVKNIE
jgi:hypothetical protein